jgi:hypothetical protein
MISLRLTIGAMLLASMLLDCSGALRLQDSRTNCAFQLPPILQRLRTIGQFGTRGVTVDAVMRVPAQRRATQPVNLTEFTSDPNGEGYRERFRPCFKTLVVIRAAEDVSLSVGAAWVRSSPIIRQACQLARGAKLVFWPFGRNRGFHQPLPRH